MQAAAVLATNGQVQLRPGQSGKVGYFCRHDGGGSGSDEQWSISVSGSGTRLKPGVSRSNSAAGKQTYGDKQFLP